MNGIPYARSLKMTIKNSYKIISGHVDRDEIISKLSIGISPKDIYEWLEKKYSTVNEKKFIIAEKILKTFKDDYLDIYIDIREDLSKTKASLKNDSIEDLQLSVQNNPEYKNLVIQTVEQELDLKKMLARLCLAVENRLSQIYDVIQENPRNINTKIDRMFNEMVTNMGALIEKAHKIINNGPDQIIQHNVSVQHMEQQQVIFYEAIKETLKQMNIEYALLFMDKYQELLNSMKNPSNKPILPIENRMIEAKMINDQINKKFSE